MKDDEKALLIACAENPKSFDKVGFSERQIYLEDIAESQGMHWKRALRIFEKWWCRGWIECGVRVGLGWMEPKGLEAAKVLREGGNPHEPT